MMKLLLLLLCVAVVVGGQNLSEDEYKIELNLEAGKVELSLKALGPYDPNAVIRVSIKSYMETNA